MSHKKGILVAEDDESVRLLLIDLLKSSGYNVIAANDGEEALRLYEENKDSIGLLLFDLGLPKLDGFEVYRRIKRKNPDIKIIAMSGWGKQATTDEFIREGVNIFIQKPYKPSNILKAVQELLTTE